MRSFCLWIRAIVFLLFLASSVPAEIGFERVQLCEGVPLRPVAPGASVPKVVPPGGKPAEVVLRQWLAMKVLLPNKREVWVDGDACRVAPSKLPRSRERVTALLASARSRSHSRLPGEVKTWELRDDAVRVHVVSARLGRKSGVRLGLTVASAYDRSRTGEDRTFRLDRSSRTKSALAAINGTFFEVRRGERGQPLGDVVIKGRPRYSPDNESLLARRRTALCWTSLRGLELREEPPRHAETVLGGLGRLARDGDPTAWRAHAGLQFDASFYSSWTRRARSLVGIGEQGRRIFLLAQGESGASKRPLSLPELSHLLVGLGARDVAFLDGGGSTQLYFRGASIVSGETKATPRSVSTALFLEVIRPTRSARIRTRRRLR